MMRDYEKLISSIRIHNNRENGCTGCGYCEGRECITDPICIQRMIDDAADAIEELLKIGTKMHTWIFLNTADEQAAYNEIGLTDEQNSLFGYSGQMILKADPPKEVE